MNKQELKQELRNQEGSTYASEAPSYGVKFNLENFLGRKIVKVTLSWGIYRIVTGFGI